MVEGISISSLETYFPFKPFLVTYICHKLIFIATYNPCNGKEDNSWIDVFWGFIMCVANSTAIINRLMDDNKLAMQTEYAPVIDATS